ncbi:MAG: hypothetical protein KatS3mg042_1747 [Rhodothermaceae bacterium]|nr:MAG: hypothetical protein KatS3mg042_1747 [Rhodothermaceae bacterium]
MLYICKRKYAEVLEDFPYNRDLRHAKNPKLHR